MIYFTLFWGFLQVGLFSFGGAYAAIPLIRDVVTSYGWLDSEMLSYMIAVSESTPGPIMVNLATYVGASKAGFLGALIATAAVVLPAFILIIFITKALVRFAENKYVSAVMNGINPCMIGIILTTGAMMIVRNILPDVHRAPDISALVITAVLALIYFGTPKISKRKISPVLLILIAAVLGIASGLLTGCSDTRKPITATEQECREATEAMEESGLLRGIWITPRKNLITSDEEADVRFAEIAEAGINLIHIHPSDCSDTVFVKRQLKAASDNNIKVIIELPAAFTDGDIENNLKIVKYAVEYPSLYGFNLQDEPVASRFECLKKEYDAIKQFAGEDVFIMINLLPNYGPKEVMAPENEPGLTWYQTYVNNCVKYDCSDIICFDYYPYHTSSETDQAALGGLISNMCDIIACAQDSGRKASAFIQDSSWSGMRIPDDVEVRFQTHLYLAFGFDNFTYFLYCQPSPTKGAEGIFKGMLTYDGERTKIYSRVQQNNKELDGLRGIYHNYTFRGLIHAGCPDYIWDSVSSRYKLKKFAPVSSVKGENVLASCFQNNSGSALYLVNTDTWNSQDVKVNLSSYSNYRVWGPDGIESMGSGKMLSVSLRPGEGKFVEIG